MKLKYNYAEIHDIEEDFIDPETKKKYDTGVCGHCGVRTKIAQERFIGVFGKSERYFCDNCGIFLRSNPFHSIFFGLAEGTVSLILFLVIAAIIKEPASTGHKFIFLPLFIGMIDGIRRSFAGIQGVFRGKINPSDELNFSQQNINRIVAENILSADACFEAGCSHSNLGRYQEAIEAFKQAIRIKPDHVKAYLNLGIAYADNGQHEEAIISYKNAIRIKPDYTDAHCDLGVTYARQGRHQEAIDAYKQAIRIEPDLAEAHFNLGVNYGKLGRNQDEIVAYQQAIRIKSDFAKAHYNLGVVYLQEVGNKGSALEEYKLLQTLDTELANKLWNLIYK